MGNYAKQIKTLLPPDLFAKKIAETPRERDRAFNILLYYLGCRCTEALNLRYQDCRYDDQLEALFITVKRLKHSKQTPPNVLYCDSPFIQDLVNYVMDHPSRLFPFSRKTGYNMVKRTMGFYPHYYRMNRISTFMLDPQYSLKDVLDYFGVTTRTLEYYQVERKLIDMGRGLK